MTVTIRQIGPCFAAEVEGIDLRKPLSRRGGRGDPCRHGPVRRAGLPRPEIDDEQQLAFTRSLGELEQAIGTSLRAAGGPACHHVRRRVQPRQGQQAVRARRPAPAVRHRQPAVALRQLVQGRSRPSIRCCTRVSIPSKGGNTEFADMRAAYDALDEETKAQVEDLVCEHSQMFSRAAARLHRFHRGGARALQAGAPAPGAHASGTGRKSLYLSSHAGAHRRLAGAGGTRASCAT